MDLKLAGKTALVLGSSRGIGYATARMLASEGCNIILNGRFEDSLQKAKNQIIAAYPNAKVSIISYDLANLEQVSSLSHKLESGEIHCDILINNTGGPPVLPLRTTPSEEWKLAAEHMLLPILEITRSAIVKMTERSWGRIISIVSSGVLQPLPELAISNTLRSSLVAWSKTLANEVAPLGITANCIIPGRIQTERLLQVDSARSEKLNISIDEVKKQSFSNIPIGRYGEPDEIAQAICFLASEGSAYITGTSIRVDGGLVKAI